MISVLSELSALGVLGRLVSGCRCSTRGLCNKLAIMGVQAFGCGWVCWSCPGGLGWFLVLSQSWLSPLGVCVCVGCSETTGLGLSPESHLFLLTCTRGAPVQPVLVFPVRWVRCLAAVIAYISVPPCGSNRREPEGQKEGSDRVLVEVGCLVCVHLCALVCFVCRSSCLA